LNWSFALQAVIFASGIGGQLLVGRFDRRGFALWLASNVLLLGTAVIQGLYGIAALYVVYAALCARQWVQWGRLPLPKSPAAAPSAAQGAPEAPTPPSLPALGAESSENAPHFSSASRLGDPVDPSPPYGARASKPLPTQRSAAAIAINSAWQAGSASGDWGVGAPSGRSPSAVSARGRMVLRAKGGRFRPRQETVEPTQPGDA